MKGRPQSSRATIVVVAAAAAAVAVAVAAAAAAVAVAAAAAAAVAVAAAAVVVVSDACSTVCMSTAVHVNCDEVSETKLRVSEHLGV